MKKISVLLALLGLAFMSSSAMAQGQHIANGVYTCNGGAQAGPCQPSSGSGSSSSGPIPDAPYEAAPAKWADRWGAIASDGASAYGIVSEQLSKRDAETAAVAECARRGGASCGVVMAYYNQCAAVVAGGGRSDLARAPSEDEAVRDSMELCRQRGGEDCRVYYSGCSLPERIQ
jgi:hypothetical protein